MSLFCSVHLGRTWSPSVKIVKEFTEIYFPMYVTENSIQFSKNIVLIHLAQSVDVLVDKLNEFAIFTAPVWLKYNIHHKTHLCTTVHTP